MLTSLPSKKVESDLHTRGNPTPIQPQFIPL